MKISAFHPQIVTLCAVLLLHSTLTLAQSPNAEAETILSQAGTVISTMVKGDNRLTPEFLRLGFHDCVGGCDGEW